MRVLNTLFLTASCLGLSAVNATGWSFTDGTVSIRAKGAGIDGGIKDKLSSTSKLEKELTIGSSDTLKIQLTTTDGDSPKRPHQAFLVLHEVVTGLEESFPLIVSTTGKAKLDLTQKDIPVQFITSGSASNAKIVLASFGSSKPLSTKVFDIKFEQDPAQPIASPEGPLRYGKLDEIHHIFRQDAKSPPKIISTFFVLVIITILPVLLGTWLYMGANFSHLSRALGNAPIGHVTFFGSIIAMEAIFFLYYTTWNLYQTLPAATLVGIVALVSGSKALTEVQERRLAGQR